jgi:hypothetical protein
VWNLLQVAHFWRTAPGRAPSTPRTRFMKSGPCQG